MYSNQFACKSIKHSLKAKNDTHYYDDEAIRQLQTTTTTTTLAATSCRLRKSVETTAEKWYSVFSVLSTKFISEKK